MEINELSLDPSLSQAEIIQKLKNYLKDSSEGLREAHLGALGGLESSRLRALSLDHLFQAVVLNLPEIYGKEESEVPISLVAVGGYGRGELNPFSDIDILILYSNKHLDKSEEDSQELLSTITDGILYKLWDCGLKVGHAVRTIDQCIHHAKEDMQSLTALLESRHIVGNKELFSELESNVMKKCIQGNEKNYMEMRLEDQRDRREKHGNSPFLQTPNIKNGCGGLRDFQNLMWMAYFKFRVRSLDDIVHRNALTEEECRKLHDAYDFLLKVRTELHYLENRPIDTIERANQEKLAKAFGYPQRLIVRRIEAFMKDYYIHVRNIYLISKTAEKNLALIRIKKNLPTFRQVIQSRKTTKKINDIDGFSIVDEMIECPNYQKVVNEPQRLMRLFLHAQKLGLEIHPSLELSIRNHVPELGNEFQTDPTIIDTFIEIISSRGSVARALRMMHELEVLGKFLPEFGKMTCLVQHEFLHQYTADEHTLVCIEHLDKIWSATQKPHAKYQDIVRGLEKPYEIYLSLLLHDSGKAIPGKKHEEVGAKLIQKVGRRFGLPKSNIMRMSRVIELHLLIPIVSQRRDLSDPSVLVEVAENVKSRRLLRLLAVHTFCDSLGTSSSLWTDFKDMLLWQLFHSTYKVLEGESQFRQFEKEEVEKKKRQVKRAAQSKIPTEEIKAHLENLPNRYVTISDVNEMVLDMQLVNQFIQLQFHETNNPFSPIIHWEMRESRGYALAKICTWNRKGFFAKLAGSITITGLTILSAHIYSRRDGIIIDSFMLVDATTGKIPDKKKRQKFEKLMHDSLTSEVEFDSLLLKKSMQRPGSLIALDSVIESRVRIQNHVSDSYNIIEVIAPDEPGLLFQVSRKLSELNLDIWLAKVVTEQGAAIDTFYFAEVEGGKITDPDRLEEIEDAVKSVLYELLSSEASPDPVVS